jgi:hypothetical protein
MKWCWWLLVSIVPSHADLAKQWDKEIVPILENYCFDCHADGVKKGDFSFDAFSDASQARCVETGEGESCL